MNTRDNELDEKELKCEHDYLLLVIDAFRRYDELHQKWVINQLDMFHSIPQNEQLLLPNVEMKWKICSAAIQKNQEILQAIVSSQNDMFTNQPFRPTEQKLEDLSPNDLDLAVKKIDKVKAIIRHLYRDWSVEGKTERTLCYQPILQSLQKEFPINRESIQVLVPGAGLGRLAYEIATLGFESEGNEISYYMLLTSAFILDYVKEPKAYSIFPWVTDTNNVLRFKDQVSKMCLPDVVPNLGNRSMSMVAGDFVEVYKNRNGFNAVVTCFFIDTAHNIIEYINTIYNLLVDGGIWINLGPLLYHYNGSDSLSIELTWEEIRTVITKVGFSLETEELVKCPYCQPSTSLQQSYYNGIYFVGRKKEMKE
ncbi:carnosine N-methyltransferase [Entamoeba marina]